MIRRTLVSLTLGAAIGAYVTAVWLMREIPSLREMIAKG